MNRISNHVSAIAVIFCVLFVPSLVHAASMTEVPRSTWAGNVSLPNYVKMYVYVPDKLATHPPILVSNHACQSSVSGQLGANKAIQAMADKNGFIMIFPDNQGQNCWDVGSKQSLTHDGGGDTHAIAQMVRYALKQYQGDSLRVYVMGGSSGGMMTQALLGVYPELFIAGAPRAGVPCGCWAESYASGNQWSGPCANGSVNKTAAQWGDFVRAINPNYTGHRPRLQIMQGASDQTISYNNMGESIKQWTNVLDLATDPDSTDKITSQGYNYNRRFWKNKCGYIVLESWSAQGQPHSMKYEEDAILNFFGLDVADGADPELAACNSSTDISSIGLPRSYHNSFRIKEKTLVLNTIQADEVAITVVNTLGQIQQAGRYKNTAQLTISLAALHPGCYSSSVTLYKDSKKTNSYNLHFVVMD